MTKDQLVYGIRNYGTPLYIFDLDAAENAVLSLRNQLGGIADICFAMKANPFLVRRMAAAADRIEVCSMGEYEICKAQKIDPEKLLISGVLKETEDLDPILADCRGKCVYTAESPNQFAHLAEWSEANGEELRVYPRLTSGNQFGMDLETVKELFAESRKYPFLTIEGLHFFSGTQKRSAETFRKELAMLDRVLPELEEAGHFPLKTLEYGPGLPVAYFAGQKDSRAENVEVLREAICGLTWKGRIVLEMGRFLAAECGYYLTAIKDLKVSNENRYCIVDGGIHQLHYDGQIRGMYQPVFEVIPASGDAADGNGCAAGIKSADENGAETEWIVCGSLCTDNDVLMKKAGLTDPKIGDTLVFHKAGAYAATEGMALFLSHALPKAAAYGEKDGWRLLRGEQPTYVWNMESAAGYRMAADDQ